MVKSMMQSSGKLFYLSIDHGDLIPVRDHGCSSSSPAEMNCKAVFVLNCFLVAIFCTSCIYDLIKEG